MNDAIRQALETVRAERQYLEAIEHKLEAITKNSAGPKRTMSAAARRRISAAHRLRWKKWKKNRKLA